MEQHLAKRTNELFDIEDKIILYDLTNTYFEGEKHNDAKLLVLERADSSQIPKSYIRTKELVLSE